MPLCIAGCSGFLGRNLTELRWLKVDKIAREGGVSTHDWNIGTTTAAVDPSALLQWEVARVHSVKKDKEVGYLLIVGMTPKGGH